MKRRNAETGKMRRPIKRTKITEGMYGNSMLYLKFVMLWATVVMADYMLEFRFEFLWPFWMMLRSVYDSFKYQGLAFSVFFICIALTSDMICYFFIPLQYIFFAASTYVWVQYVWYTFADKGICLPSVALCCLVVYCEAAVRGGRGLEASRPLAAHAVGYPAVTLGFGVKSYIGHRLRARTQRQVRAQNEFYFQLMRDALPESALEQNETAAGAVESVAAESAAETRHMNGSVRKRRPDLNGHAHHPPDANHIHTKVDKVDKQTAQSPPHALSNGSPAGAPAHTDERHEHGKGGAKSSKCEKKEGSTLKEEKRKSKNKDKDKDKDIGDSHKSTEHKEHIVKEVENTKENVKSKECNGYKDKDKEREREMREREREREREKELREGRSCIEELKRVKAELAAAQRGEAEARRALAAAAAAERARRADHLHLKQAYAALQHKLHTWRTADRRSRGANGANGAGGAGGASGAECGGAWCSGRRSALEAEGAALRRELQRAREHAQQLQRDLAHTTEQVRTLEAARAEDAAVGANGVGGAGGVRGARAWAALHERAAHLQRSLSAETRVKLDLLSALGDAKRQIHIQEGLLSNKEKEIEELKAQMLAVMPAEFVSALGGGMGGSPLDPNASVYTPKQLCSDA